MKIAIADNNGLKFTKDLKEHWEAQGHEVKYERGASEFLAQWADVYYVDTWDNNIHYLYKLYHGQHDDMPADWDNSKKPRIVVRILDWEVWIGLVRSQEMIDWVDDVIVIAPHIQNKLLEDKDNATGNPLDWKNKITLIRPGVNLDRFTIKSQATDGFQLGMVLGDMWWPKNHMAGLDIFTQLYRKDNRWRLHIRGQHEPGEYWRVMTEHYVQSRGITNAVLLYDRVEDMNAWYEQIDILLHPGMKEAFCYAVGEALAKDIPVVVNEFYGATDIWPEDLLYQTHDQAIQMIEQAQKRETKQGRGFISSNYSTWKMFKEYDALLGI